MITPGIGGTTKLDEDGRIGYEAEEPPDSCLPLTGVRVLECGSLIAAPFAGQLLGDFGAEVIKVEDPKAGDPMRGWGLQVGDGVSLHWQIIGRNKKSVTADLRVEEGRQLVRKLAGHCDVVLENFRPGTLEKWGLGYDVLAKLNPGLILTRVSGFGQTGPYASRAGFGSIGEAMGGIRAVTGEADRPPARVGVSLGDSLAAVFAFVGTLLALRVRDRTGRGQVVDAAIYEAVLAVMESLLPEWELAGSQRPRSGAVLPGVAPSNIYSCADGKIILIAANRDTVFERLTVAMGAPELASDPRFASHSARGEHQVELDGLIEAWTRTCESGPLLSLLHDAGVPAGPIYHAADMLADEHFAARQAIVRLMHPQLGGVPMQNAMPRLSATPGSVRDPAPDLGQHNKEIYEGLLRLADEDMEGLRAQRVI